MEHEFNNRVAAQRTILRLVNRKVGSSEQLFGLSSKAIDRWVSINNIEPSSRIVKLIKEVSAKLLFLANKSQEQVSDEYATIRAEIAVAYESIRIELDRTAI